MISNPMERKNMKKFGNIKKLLCSGYSQKWRNSMNNRYLYRAKLKIDKKSTLYGYNGLDMMAERHTYSYVGGADL